MSDPSPFDDFEDQEQPQDVTHDDAVDLGSFDTTAGSSQQGHIDLDAGFGSTSHTDDAFGLGGGDHDAKHEDDPFGSASASASHENHNEEDAFGFSSQSQGLGATQDFQQPPADEMAFNGPTPLSIWENERSLVIQQRISKAKADKQKALEDAQNEIKQFYKQRQDAISKTQAGNREEEKNLKSEMDALMSNGTLWEKVGRLSNLQPKANEDRKVARMRKLLLTLKNDRVDEDMKPANAAKANGISKSKGGR